jgi:hypothetical protein
MEKIQLNRAAALKRGEIDGGFPVKHSVSYKKVRVYAACRTFCWHRGQMYIAED